MVLQLKGEFEEAATVLRKTVNDAPDHVMSRTALMIILRKLGSSLEAEEQETTARNLVTRDTEYNRACFEAICGNTDQALELLSIGLEKKQATKAWAWLDPDLETIRSNPQFKELVGK